MRRSRWSRGVALLFMAVWAVSRGIAYLPQFEPRDVPMGVRLLIEGLPWLSISGYGVMWLIAAACAVVGALVQRDLWAYIAVLAMGTFAGMAFSLSWIGSFWLDYGSGDWRQAGQYVGTTGALLASMWRRPAVRRTPRTVTPKEAK